MLRQKQSYKKQVHKLLNLLAEDAKIVNKNTSLQPLENKQVTITGATGLVGLNILSALDFYNRNYAKEPISINAILHKKTRGLISEFFSHEAINVLYGDLTDHGFLESLPDSDFIIHSAGYAQPGKFLDNTLKTININSVSTLSLLKRLKKNGNFLFISSAEVYSGNPKNLNHEDDIGTTNPSHKRACYIEGKRIGETIINIHREMGIKATSARLALAYGPGVRPNDLRVLNQFIERGKKGSIDLLDDGKAMRTYCYITDVTSMLLSILMKSTFPVYNVGGKSAISIKDLALKIGKLMNVPVQFPDSSVFMDDAPSSVGLDLSRIETEHGLLDYVGMDEGLKKTIEWIKLNDNL